MIRFLPFYLHDGIKSVYRLIYAIEKLTKDEALHALQEEKTFMEKHGLLVGVGGTVAATGLGYAAWRHHKKKEAEKDYADYVDWGDSP